MHNHMIKWIENDSRIVHFLLGMDNSTLINRLQSIVVGHIVVLNNTTCILYEDHILQKNTQTL